MGLINENFRWLTLVVPFSILSLFTDLNVLSKALLSVSIYAGLGGWRFIRVLVLTLPRDMIGLKSLILVNYYVWNMKRKHETVPDLFEQTVRRKPKSVAFMYENEKWTFEEMDQYANRVANYLIQFNIKPGDVVGLFMENRPCYVAIWIGISKIGAVPALINFNLRQTSLIHCIRDGDCIGIVNGVELTDVINEISNEIQNNCKFQIIIDGNKTTTTNLNSQPSVSHDDIINKQSPIPPSPLIRHQYRKVYDALLYIYTSGTTGMPKAAKVSHTRYLMMSYGVYSMLGIRQSDIVYNSLPLYHTAGGMIGVGLVILSGSCMAIRRKFSASNFWNDCVKYDATVVQYIGEVCRYLLSQPHRPEEQSHRVRVAFGNGIRPQIWEQFQQRFGIKMIGEFYGATESNANMVNNMNKVGSVGYGTRILPFLYPITLIRVDSVTGEPVRDSSGLCIQCQPNEVGELVGKIRTRDTTGQFDGYVNSQATNKKIVENVFHKGDRAFLTGDLLMQDELGYFYFKDRAGDTYRWKGENISTAEVEAIISNILGLNDCVVYGVEVPNCEGRAGMAAIVDPEFKIKDFSTLYQQLSSTLPAYAKPLFLRQCNSIEMTGTFKMKKINLVKEGYNPEIVKDKLFYVKNGSYHEMTNDIYVQIINGIIKF